RARWEIDGYVFNLGLAQSWFAGDEITFLPKAERDSFPWTQPLAAALENVAEPVRRDDLERVRAEVEQIAGRRALSGLRAGRLARERQLPAESGAGRAGGRPGAARVRAPQ